MYNKFTTASLQFPFTALFTTVYKRSSKGVKKYKIPYISFEESKYHATCYSQKILKIVKNTLVFFFSCQRAPSHLDTRFMWPFEIYIGHSYVPLLAVLMKGSYEGRFLKIAGYNKFCL